MATFTIRDISEAAAQAIRERAAAAGQATETYIRAWIERQAQEPVVKASYGLKAFGADGSRMQVSRWAKGLTGQGGANLSQEQAETYKRVVLLVERNEPGDRERAIGLLSAVFEEVFEVAG